MLTIQRLKDGTYKVSLHHKDGPLEINHDGVYKLISGSSDVEPDPNWIKFTIKTSPDEVNTK